MTATDRMTWSEAVAAIAQGAINITEGLTEIEAGSRVHRGMSELCRILSERPEITTAARASKAKPRRRGPPGAKGGIVVTRQTDHGTTLRHSDDILP